MSRDGQHSRFHDRHRRRASARDLLSDRPARRAISGPVLRFMRMPSQVRRCVRVPVHDVAALAAQRALAQRDVMVLGLGAATCSTFTPVMGRVVGPAAIAGAEPCAVRRYLAVRRSDLPWLFLSERGQPLTRLAVSYLVDVATVRAGLPNVLAHTLRHSCGHYLANKGCNG